MKLILTLSLTLLSFIVFQQNLRSQDSLKVVQFSGVVVTEDDNGEMMPLPYTNISIMGTSRGTISEIDGFFSLVAQELDTLVFSRIGFKSVEMVVQDTLQSSFYSWYQVMSKDSVLLPEAVIYPWPTREHYKIEFLALNVDQEMRLLAEANMAQNVLDRMRFSVPVDGREAYKYVVQNQMEEYKYMGQYKPQNIFNPIAWAQFIKAWRRGDFKKKKKKE